MIRRPLSLLFLFSLAIHSPALVRADDPKPKAQAADPARVHPPGELPADARLKGQRTLNDAYHPWTPPNTLEAWQQEAARIRRQLQVACGLWPMPERPPVEPVIHGAVDRGDYTIERVYFRSRPGLYVTGSLFRPKKGPEKKPTVLCPYGHWLNGRFYDAGDEAAKGEFASGAEDYLSGARYPLQARMVQLVRMGCNVFHYDMIGVADDQPLPHREGFNDAAAELWQQNKMGLQTWNSLRALDFVLALPDVDPARIGVTGASGGGTQTFMLCALDDRPAVAFPAVMVGTAMQGGCQCENASYLRLGINNIAIAALTAPRPMKMSGANDWTIDIETKGLPELKAIYGLYGKPELVAAKCHPEFGHNYNQVSREMMYEWMAKHLGLGDVPVEQVDFWPLTRAELTVFDKEHPLPEDALTADKLRELMTKESQEAFTALIPKSKEGLAEYRTIVGGAAEVMLGSLPKAESLPSRKIQEQNAGDLLVVKASCGLEGQDIPTLAVANSKKFDGRAVIWLDGQSKSHLLTADGKPTAAVQRLIDSGYSVVSADVFLTGEFLKEGQPASYPVDDNFPGYTFGYNAPLLSQRVRDILAVIAAVKSQSPVTSVSLVGTGDAGLWALLARAVAGDAVAKTVVDIQGFQFNDVTQSDDARLLPGALRFGGLDGLAALIAPHDAEIYGAKGDWPATKAVGAISGARLVLEAGPLDEAAVMKTLLGK